ncbi:MAG: hypothetical protein ACK6AD_00815 [Cyanobacteriota bacterium]
MKAAPQVVWPVLDGCERPLLSSPPLRTDAGGEGGLRNPLEPQALAQAALSTA